MHFGTTLLESAAALRLSAQAMAPACRTVGACVALPCCGWTCADVSVGTLALASTGSIAPTANCGRSHRGTQTTRLPSKHRRRWSDDRQSDLMPRRPANSACILIVHQSRYSVYESPNHQNTPVMNPGTGSRSTRSLLSFKGYRVINLLQGNLFIEREQLVNSAMLEKICQT